jgi:hypothetical protein
MFAFEGKADIKRCPNVRTIVVSLVRLRGLFVVRVEGKRRAAVARPVVALANQGDCRLVPTLV